MISININKPHLTPLYDVYSHIVYAAMASDVDMVMVNGKVLVNSGRLMTGDESEILSQSPDVG